MVKREKEIQNDRKSIKNIIDHFLVFLEAEKKHGKNCKAFDGIEFFVCEFAVAELGNIEFIDWKSFFNKNISG